MTRMRTVAVMLAVVLDVGLAGVMMSSAHAAPVPAPWANADVGGPELAGSASYDPMDDSFTVTGEGVDIWDTWDQFQYVYQPLPGECMITARVVSIENTHAWAKAGVMVRETLDGDARHAMMITPGNGATFQWRPETGGLMDHRTQDGLPAPYWVRIVCEGVTARGYHSPDGVNWTLQASVTVPPDPAYNPYIGLAVCSHNPGALCTAVFDNVSIEDVPEEECRLVAHWSLDEGQGTIAHDTSGNDLHGTLVGDPEWVESLPGLGQALEFDGIHDHVDCGNDPVFNMTEQMTATAWVNITSLSREWAGVVAKGNGLAWRLSTVGSEPRFHFAPTGCCPWVHVNGETSVGLGEWHHLCGTYDGSMIRMYLDGEEDASEPYSDGMSTSELPVYIGANPEVPEFRFHGLIDEVRIYNCALSPEEIADLVRPAECFPMCHPDYLEWVAVGKPDCWCYPRQCHGDADGEVGGSEKTGQYHVGPADLGVLIDSWLVKEPPHGEGIVSVPNGVCADFAHDQGGSDKTGVYRVGPTDLSILIANWLKKEPPFGPDVQPDCLDCDFEFFEEVPAWRMPDPAVVSLTVEPDRVNPGERVVLSASVSNLGPGATGPVALVFLVDDVEIEHIRIGPLKPAEQVQVSAAWGPERPGRHRVLVQVELDEDGFDRALHNNARTAVIRVSGEAIPEPELDFDSIDFDVPELIPGESCRITLNVRNPSFAHVHSIPVEFYIDDEHVSSGLIEYLPPHERQQFQISWRQITPGDHMIGVRMDLPETFPDADLKQAKSWHVTVPHETVLYSSMEKDKWVSIGPAVLTNGVEGMPTGSVGRIDRIAFDPKDPSRMFAGAPTGGLWWSSRYTGPSNWHPMTDGLPSLYSGAVAVDPENHNIVYWGTGFSWGPEGVGIFKSFGLLGDSWHLFASHADINPPSPPLPIKFVEKLVVRYPKPGQVLIYAATDIGVLRYTSWWPGDPKSEPSEWTRIKTGEIWDISVNPNDDSEIIASVIEGGLWRTTKGESAQGDADWQEIFPRPASTWGQFRFDVFWKNPKTIWVALNSPGGIWKDKYNLVIFKSVDNGQTWSPTYKFNMDGLYNAFIRVHPSDPDEIYFGGIKLYWCQGDCGEDAWEIGGVHDDQKDFQWDPTDSDVFYVTGDGGVFRCEWDGEDYSCEARNFNLRVTQFYDLDASQTNPKLMIGGTQDNGTIMYEGSPDWKIIRGGDGLYSLIAPGDQVFYAQHQHLHDDWGTDRCHKGVNCSHSDWKPAKKGLPEGDPWGMYNAYITVHPKFDDFLLSQGQSVYATTDGGKNWTPQGPGMVKGTKVEGYVRRVVFQPKTFTWIAGTSKGEILYRQAGTWYWLDKHPDKGAYVTNMAFAPTNHKVLYVTYAGCDAYRRIQRFEMKADGSWQGDWIAGSVWAANSLPVEHKWAKSKAEVEIWCIAGDGYSDTVAYVGTDRGVFRGQRMTGSSEWSWKPYNTGLPWAEVRDLLVDTKSKELRAATFGRGAWTVITGP